MSTVQFFQFNTFEYNSRKKGTSNYIKFHHNIRAGALYDPLDPAVDGLLHDMATNEFRSVGKKI